jgi:transposase
VPGGGSPDGQQRRQFSPEFKADAVALVRSTGRPIAAIAKELGVGESNLSYWLKKDEESRAAADPGRFETESADARENAALGRRVAELEVEREILKRATALTGLQRAGLD